MTKFSRSDELDFAALDLDTLFGTFSGTLSVAFQRLDGPGVWTHNPEAPMLSASLIKLPILLTALAQVARGELTLAERIPLQAAEQVGGSGVLQTLGAGLELSVLDLLTLMIIISDNTATNMVIGRVGQAQINAFLQQHGFRGTTLVGKLQLPEAAMNEAQRRGERNRTCATDMLGMLTGLVRGDLLPPAETAQALAILKQQQITEALARYLPTDDELDTPAVQVASKSGSVRGVRHDAGLVFRGDTPLYALVVMTSGSADLRFGVDNEGLLLIAEVSRRIFAHVAA